MSSPEPVEVEGALPAGPREEDHLDWDILESKGSGGRGGWKVGGRKGWPFQVEPFGKSYEPYELVNTVTRCRVHKAESSVSSIQYCVLRARGLFVAHSRCSISMCGMSE